MVTESTFFDCQFHLRSSLRYSMVDSLPDIGNVIILYHVIHIHYNYVARPGKTDHLGTFIVLRNVNLNNLNNSLSYNSAVVNSRGMEIALEIQHLFSFK